jgi:hypothetical protein
MAASTLRAFVDALEAIVVTGVTRRYTSGPPESVDTADLPAQFVQLPQLSDQPFNFGNHGGWPTFRADIVIAYEPVAQNTNAVNFDGTVDMVDSLTSAIRALSITAALAALSWTSRQTTVEIAGTSYWAVVTTVEGTTRTT